LPAAGKAPRVIAAEAPKQTNQHTNKQEAVGVAAEKGMQLG
jgi:hypothetical protein